MQETLTTEQEAAIIRFARDNGRTWKQALGAAWMDGSDANEVDGGYLRQVRNQFGPRWLFNYKLPKNPKPCRCQKCRTETSVLALVDNRWLCLSCIASATK